MQTVNLKNRIAIVTGASSGIGAATAIRFAQLGMNLAICARREDRLDEIATQCESEGVKVLKQVVDINNQGHRKSFFNNIYKTFDQVDILVNNAGLALSRDNYVDTSSEDVMTMFNTNVFAVHEFTKLILPKMIEAQNGHLVFINSVAGQIPYAGGAAYCGSKHALGAMVDALRLEIFMHPIRISMFNPGAVNTEFSLVRFKGDQTTADAVYEGYKPLNAEDIADSIEFAVTRPKHVVISEESIYPVHQADARTDPKMAKKLNEKLIH